MPYTDGTVEPAITILLPHEVKELPLLKETSTVQYDSGITDVIDGEDLKIVGPKYNYDDLYNHTKRMMGLMMINYSKPTNIPKLEDIPEDIREKLKPFAHFLAILDGNAFEGLVDQYIPEVYAFMAMDGYAFVDETLEKINDLKA
jgi:hypothetical protein